MGGKVVWKVKGSEERGISEVRENAGVGSERKKG